MEGIKNHLDICEANICPLDPDIKDRNWIEEDKVCRYIKMYLKGQRLPKNVVPYLQKNEDIILNKKDCETHSILSESQETKRIGKVVA